MRRRLVWIQGGRIYRLIYGFSLGGIFPFVDRHTVTGLIELANPTPAFDQTFDIGTQGSSPDIAFSENNQGRMAATISGGGGDASILRFYSARNALAVDVSLRLEQLSSAVSSNPQIFARAFVILARIKPLPSQVVAQQEIIIYGNEPIGTIRTWAGTLSAP